jgi:hypothetical protein
MTLDLYRFFDANDQLLYVGISLSAVTRMAQHRGTQPWWHEVATVKVQQLGARTRQEAQAIERAAIHAEQPRHNVIHNRPSHTPRAVQQWVCMKCRDQISRGSQQGFLQVPAGSEGWQCVCLGCDPIGGTLYWIDSGRLTNKSDVHRWSLHLRRKRWFDAESWLDMIRMSCRIDGALADAQQALSQLSR